VTSRLPAALDALLDTFGAVTQSYDGPEALPGVWPDEFVIVGGTDDPDDDTASASYEWAGLGAKQRNESGEITCALIVQRGDIVVKANRDRAFTVMAALEAAVVADPTLGGAVQSGWFLPSGVTYSQRQNDRGSFARIVLTVTYQSRI
jgi:hypothetical protein